MAAAAAVPHFTYHDEADVTRLNEVRDALRAHAPLGVPKLTALPLIVKACSEALRVVPELNATAEGAGGDVTLTVR
eukprot:CAMPEP_0183802204 /NCGR_PEP_ID=MMETSP0803_2-20130417/29795_1 /TAXON_ID=195967 /ORGANISM="Crustomastix stigmata, Strain CCMP3273" /LENGTH=75 /DNA_ID=CAMNT_0026046939 /DNA_START=18 /DNA_END=242 /DNA_ORIENTATION=+